MKHALLAAGAAILAATASPADAHGPAQGATQGVVKLQEPITPLFKHELPNVPGNALLAEKPRVYRAGESWYEAPGAHHPGTRNPSKTTPAKLPR